MYRIPDRFSSWQIVREYVDNMTDTRLEIARHLLAGTRPQIIEEVQP
jgi:hypothetical protein